MLGILGVLVVVFWDVIKYRIEDLKHAHYLSQVKEREEYYKNHIEEAKRIANALKKEVIKWIARLL